MPVFTSSWLYCCISMKSKVGSSLGKVKTESQKDPLPQTLPPSTGETQCPVTHPASPPSSETGACRRMKPNTGSHSPSENVRETPRCWLRRLTAATPEYFTTPGSSERWRESGSQCPSTLHANRSRRYLLCRARPRRGSCGSSPGEGGTSCPGTLPRRWAHPPAQTRVPEGEAKAENRRPCSFLFVPLPFCPFTFTSCQSRLPEQIQAKFCNYQ